MRMKTSIFTVGILASMLVVGCGGSEKAPAGETAPAKVESKSGNTNMKVGPIKINTSEKGSIVTMPGINVSTDENGNSKVVMPGVTVDGNEDGTAKVNVDGLEVDIKTEGENSEVEVGGMKIKTEGEDADIDMEGIKIKTEGEDADINVGGIKIEKNGGKSKIQLPGGLNIETGD